jgi:hypothetical protein
MPLVQYLLLNVPTLVLGILFTVLAVSLSVLGLIITRRVFPKHILKMHHEITGAIFGALAMAYTVLLAFVVVIAWQNFDKAKTNVETEANCLVDLHRNSAAFPEFFRGQAQAAIKDYVDMVMDDEWPLLAKGEESMKSREALRRLWSLYTAFEPKTEKEKIFFAESVEKLNDLRETRRLRIIESRTGVHPMLWFVLIAGGITTIGFTFFYGAESFAAHAVMASTLAVLIAMILFTILLFDYPFTGSAHIGIETFQQIVSF